MKLKNRILLILAFSILLLFIGSIIFIVFLSMDYMQFIYLAIVVAVIWAIMYIYNHVNY